jgi:hypothetical protein
MSMQDTHLLVTKVPHNLTLMHFHRAAILNSPLLVLQSFSHQHASDDGHAS